MITLPLKNDLLWSPSASDLSSWITSYPDVDVEYELGCMSDWLLTHPDKRTSVKQIRRFVCRWLERHSTHGLYDSAENLSYLRSLCEADCLMDAIEFATSAPTSHIKIERMCAIYAYRDELLGIDCRCIRRLSSLISEAISTIPDEKLWNITGDDVYRIAQSVLNNPEVNNPVGYLRICVLNMIKGK